MANGYITIGTELNTDKFDKQIANLEKKMQKEENKKIEIEAKLDTNLQDLENQKKEVDRLAEAYQRMQKIKSSLEKGTAKPSDFSTFSEMEKQYGSLEKLGSSFDKALAKQDQLELKANQTKRQYEEINQNVTDYASKIESVKFNKQQAEIEQVKQGFDRVGSSIQNAVKQAGRMVLSIIGIRTGLAMLRRASGELATYDTQYATNLEYIRFALTQMIAPVLRYIVGLVATILQYINAIVSAWFGINLFSNASAKNFQKMKAGASGVAKAAKEIKKQLAGFDEINMLSDNKDTNGGGGASGIATPNFDLGSDVQIPAWLQWIIDNKDLILSILAGITAGLIALKLGASGLMALGIGIAVMALVDLIQDIIDFIEDPSWDKFADILGDISLLLVGVAIAMLAVNAANPVAWILLLIAVIAAVAAAVIKHWDEIKEVMGKVGNWINENIIQPVIKFFQDLWDKIKTGVTNAWNSVVSILSKVSNWINEHIIQPVGTFFSNLWNGFKEGAINAWNGIVSIFSKIGNFFSGIISTIKEKLSDFGSRAGETVSSAFKGVVNTVLNAIENVLNTPIKSINSLISSLNNIPRCKYFN